MKRKAARKLAQKKRKQEKQMQEQLEKKQKKMQEELRDIDSYQSLTLEQGFDNIFASDSDTSSFEVSFFINLFSIYHSVYYFFNLKNFLSYKVIFNFFLFGLGISISRR